MVRDRFEPSAVAQAGCQREDGEHWTLAFVRDLRHPRESVWAALTEPAQLAEWAPFLADRDLGVVGDATLTMIDGDAREEMAASVLRVEPPSLLEYNWGADTLRWELAETALGTRLTLRHTMPDRDWVPKVAAGWHLCLDVAEHLLDGQPVGPIRGSAALHFGWDELRRAYATKLDIPDTD